MPPFSIPYTFSYGSGPSDQTVGAIIDEVQALVQDVGAVRYPLSRYVAALNAGLAEGYRLRPDFYRGMTTPPRYLTTDLNAFINWPTPYTWPLIMFCVGYITLTEAQGNDDARGAAFQTAFVQKLTQGAR